VLSKFLKNPLEKRPYLDLKHKEIVQSKLLQFISSLAKYFDKNSESTLNIYERVIDMLNSPSQDIKKSISKCIPPLARLLEDNSKKFLKQLLMMMLKSTSLDTLIGAAYAIAGIIKGLGSYKYLTKE
jgi:hypothetical protein